MFKVLLQWSPNLLETLSYLRTKALRRKVWFNTLTEQERITISMVNKHVKIVKNTTLATVIAKIMAKLITAIKNSFINSIERLGRNVAESWAKSAYITGWSVSWVNDPDIVRWFGMMAYYSKVT